MKTRATATVLGSVSAALLLLPSAAFAQQPAAPRQPAAAPATPAGGGRTGAAPPPPGAAAPAGGAATNPLAAAPPSMAGGGTTANVKVERGAGGKKVYRITEEIRIEGKIQKPEAFYVLQKSSINYEWQELKQEFVPKILDSVTKAPF